MERSTKPEILKTLAHRSSSIYETELLSEELIRSTKWMDRNYSPLSKNGFASNEESGDGYFAYHTESHFCAL